MKKQRTIALYLWATVMLSQRNFFAKHEQSSLQGLLEDVYREQKESSSRLQEVIQQKAEEQEKKLALKTDELKNVADKHYEILREEAQAQIATIKKVAQEGIGAVTQAVEEKSQKIRKELNNSIKTLHVEAAEQVFDLLNKSDEQLFEKRRQARERALARISPSAIGLQSLSSWKSKTAQECNQSLTMLKSIVLDGEESSISKDFIDEFSSYQRWFDLSLHSTHSPQDPTYQEILRKKERLDDVTSMQKKADLILERSLNDGTITQEQYKKIRLLVLYDLNSHYAYRRKKLSTEDIAALVNHIIRTKKDTLGQTFAIIPEPSLPKNKEKNKNQEKKIQESINNNSVQALELTRLPETSSLDNLELKAQFIEEKQKTEQELQLLKLQAENTEKKLTEEITHLKEKINNLKTERKKSFTTQEALKKSEEALLEQQEKLNSLEQALSLAALEEKKLKSDAQKNKNKKELTTPELFKKLSSIDQEHSNQALTTELAEKEYKAAEEKELLKTQAAFTEAQLKEEILALKEELARFQAKAGRSKERKAKILATETTLRKMQEELFKKQEELSTHQQVLALAELENKHHQTTAKKLRKKQEHYKTSIDSLQNELFALQKRQQEEIINIQQKLKEEQFEHTLQQEERREKIAYQKNKIQSLKHQLAKKHEELSLCQAQLKLHEEKLDQQQKHHLAQEKVKRELATLTEQIKTLQKDYAQEKKQLEKTAQTATDLLITQNQIHEEERTEHEISQEIAEKKELELTEKIITKERLLKQATQSVEKILNKAEEQAGVYKKNSEQLQSIAEELLVLSDKNQKREDTLEQVERQLIEKTAQLEQQRQFIEARAKNIEQSLAKEIEQIQELNLSITEKSLDQEVKEEQLKNKERDLTKEHANVQKKAFLQKQSENLALQNKQLLKELEEKKVLLEIKEYEQLEQEKNRIPLRLEKEKKMLESDKEDLTFRDAERE